MFVSHVPKIDFLSRNKACSVCLCVWGGATTATATKQQYRPRSLLLPSSSSATKNKSKNTNSNTIRMARFERRIHTKQSKMVYRNVRGLNFHKSILLLLFSFRFMCPKQIYNFLFRPKIHAFVCVSAFLIFPQTKRFSLIEIHIHTQISYKQWNGGWENGKWACTMYILLDIRVWPSMWCDTYHHIIIGIELNEDWKRCEYLLQSPILSDMLLLLLPLLLFSHWIEFGLEGISNLYVDAFVV